MIELQLQEQPTKTTLPNMRPSNDAYVCIYLSSKYA